MYQAPAAPESASQISIQLTEWIASGDLNGVPSAAVVLVGSGGGSGSFYSLHVVQEVDGAYQEVASTLLGDRVIVEGLAIQDDTVQVRMTTHGPDDPMCCPTLASAQALQAGGRPADRGLHAGGFIDFLV